jgi:anti-sigma-K factor RskA
MLRRSPLFALVPGIIAAITLVATLGCGHAKPSLAPEQPKTLLHVTNSEFLDATIYVVVDRGQRVRLGTASSNRETTFEIPPHLLFAAVGMSFIVDPIGGSPRPSTGDMVIAAGDEIELRLSGGRAVLTKR